MVYNILLEINSYYWTGKSVFARTDVGVINLSRALLSQ